MGVRAPAIKGYRLVWRLPWAGSEEEQEGSNLKALNAELHLRRIGVRSRIVGHYDRILVYANSVDMLRNEEAIRALKA